MKIVQFIANTFRIFAQSVSRLFHSLFTVLIVCFVLAFPAIGSWYAIASNWNLADNTASMKVGVVNEDVGALGDSFDYVMVGNQVVKNLRDDGSYQWEVASRSDATSRLKSGEYAYAIVIPATFSEDVLSALRGSFQRPVVESYVGTEVSRVASGLGSSSALAKENDVDSEFMSTVSGVLLRMSEVATDGSGAAENAVNGSLTTMVAHANESVGQVKDLTSRLEVTYNAAESSIKDAQTGLTNLQRSIPTIPQSLTQANMSMDALRGTVQAFSTQLGGQITDVELLLGQVASNAHGDIGQALGNINQIQGQISGVLGTIGQIVNSNQGLIDELKPYQSQYEGVQAGIAQIESTNQELKDSIDGLTGLSANLSQTSQQIETDVNAIDQQTQSTADLLEGGSSSVNTEVLPKITTALDQLTRSLGTLEGACLSLDPTLSSTQTVMTQLLQTTGQSRNVMGMTTTTLDTISQSLQTAQADLESLRSTASVEAFAGALDMDASQMAQVLAAPVTMKSVSLSPLNNYGSSLIPLVCNLAVWISAILLVLLLRFRVQPPGIKASQMQSAGQVAWQSQYSAAQIYLGRWLLFVAWGIAFSLILCSGIFILGVSVQNPVAFIAAFALTAIADVSILFFLTYLTRPVGIALGVVLLLLQLPLCYGFESTQMMPPLFQLLYPILPFTYSLNAMGDALRGIVSDSFVLNLVSVALMGFLAVCVGTALSRIAGNLDTLYSRQLSKGELLAAGKPLDVNRRFQFRSIIYLLLDSNAYRSRLIGKSRRFTDQYSILMSIGWSLIIVLPILLVLLVFAVNLAFELKLALVGILGIFTVVVGLYLMIVEYANFKLSSQLALLAPESQEAVATAPVAATASAAAPQANTDTQSTGILDPVNSEASVEEGADTKRKRRGWRRKDADKRRANAEGISADESAVEDSQPVVTDGADAYAMSEDTADTDATSTDVPQEPVTTDNPKHTGGPAHARKRQWSFRKAFKSKHQPSPKTASTQSQKIISAADLVAMRKRPLTARQSQQMGPRPFQIKKGRNE